VLRYLKGFDCDSDEKMAYEVIEKVGPGGHFLTQKHTRKNFKTEFFRPALSDRQSFDSWSKDSLDTKQRAKLKWQEVLASYTPPELDPVIKEKVEAFIEKRSKELLK